MRRTRRQGDLAGSDRADLHLATGSAERPDTLTQTVQPNSSNPLQTGRAIRFFVPEADPAERVVEGRERGHDAQAALQLGLEFGQRDVRRRLDQPAQVRFMRLQEWAAMAAIAFRG